MRSPSVEERKSGRKISARQKHMDDPANFAFAFLGKEINRIIRTKLSPGQKRRLQVLMNLKMLAVDTMDNLLRTNKADTAARKQALRQQSLPFRISPFPDKRTHQKMVGRCVPFLNPMLYPEYEELLEQQQEPWPLTFCVRYDHAKVKGFVKSLQEHVYGQKSSDLQNLRESQMLQRSFGWLNSQITVVYIAEVGLSDPFTVQ